MFERFTDEARRVVVFAQEESRELGHNFIGAEHLLLGVIRSNGVVAQVFTTMEVLPADIRERIVRTVGQGTMPPFGHIPFNAGAKTVLERSLREALELHHSYIGPEHILLALTWETNGTASQAMMHFDLHPDRVRRAVVRIVGQGEPGPEFSPPRMPQPIHGGGGIRPAACSFCSTPSPECGPMFTGDTGALICARCAGAVSGVHGPTFATRLIAMSQQESIDVRAARHEPSGPPPDDEDAARRAIEDAYMHPMEVGGDGRTLINVEDGAALAECAQEIRSRVGQFLDQSVNIVDHIKFLNAGEAVVWSTVLINGRPPIPALSQSEGRAVLVDGRWKVARQTMCQRWAHAGVICPPPAST